MKFNILKLKNKRKKEISWKSFWKNVRFKMYDDLYKDYL